MCLYGIISSVLSKQTDQIVKCLGGPFDGSLCFKEHIDFIIITASNGLAMMRTMSVCHGLQCLLLLLSKRLLFLWYSYYFHTPFRALRSTSVLVGSSWCSSQFIRSLVSHELVDDLPILLQKFNRRGSACKHLFRGLDLLHGRTWLMKPIVLLL